MATPLARYEFTVTGDDNQKLGRFEIIEVADNPSVIDLDGYTVDASGVEQPLITNTMRLYSDSIERQLPAVLEAIGIEDQSQQDLMVAAAVAWVVALTGGVSRDYFLADDQHRSAHVIAYSDGEESIFPFCVTEDGTPHYVPQDVKMAPDGGYHVTKASELDDGGFRRATISRPGFPTHVVRWKMGSDSSA